MPSPARTGLCSDAPTAATTLSPLALNFTPAAARTPGVARRSLHGAEIGTDHSNLTAFASSQPASQLNTLAAPVANALAVEAQPPLPLEGRVCVRGMEGRGCVRGRKGVFAVPAGKGVFAIQEGEGVCAIQEEKCSASSPAAFSCSDASHSFSCSECSYPAFSC